MTDVVALISSRVRSRTRAATTSTPLLGSGERGCFEPDACATNFDEYRTGTPAQPPPAEHTAATKDADHCPSTSPSTAVGHHPIRAEARDPPTPLPALRRASDTRCQPSLATLPSWADDVSRDYGASPRSPPIIMPPTSPGPRSPERDAQGELRSL